MNSEIKPLRRVAVERYVTPLREGGSMPAVVEADDLGLYVLKFRGAGQGVRALIAEIISGGIARALHMPAETVRRRLNALIEAQVLVERNDGLVLAADNPLRLGSNQESWLFITHQFERLVRDLKARGVTLDERPPPVS